MSNLPPRWPHGGRNDVVLIRGLLQTGQRLITILGAAVWQDNGCPVSRTRAPADSLARYSLSIFQHNRQGYFVDRSLLRSGSARSLAIQKLALLDFCASQGLSPR